MKQLGLFDDTLLVFTSDNGATFELGNQGTSASLDSNRPLRGQKRTLWEGGLRVPGLVHWPGKVRGGQSCSYNIHHMDFLPTFVAAAGTGARKAPAVDGVNLLPLWTGTGIMAERTLFWEWQSEGVDQLAALRGDWKLLVDHGSQPELYNLAVDTAERRDVSGTNPERVQRLRRELAAWLSTQDARGRE